ncbi:MAG: hypothetical protein K2O04_01730 [Clostridiales bacterium]|nr:hypothetical protein [Clostridiales bacterium]
MKKTDNKNKVIPSPLILGGMIFSAIFLIGVFVFFICVPSDIETDLWIYIVAGVILLGGSLLIFFLGARRFLSIVVIDENGISRAFLDRFFKLSMKWDEIYEFSYFESGLPFLIISKTKSIQGMSYWKITKIKDLIQIQLSQKNYDKIKQYIKQPIVGLTEAKMAQLKLKK